MPPKQLLVTILSIFECKLLKQCLLKANELKLIMVIEKLMPISYNFS